MIEKRIVLNAARLLARVALLAFYCYTPSACAGEDSFPVLQIGTHSYTNVTVTTKAKDYIFILHSTGMQNIRVADLTPELKEQLGYHVEKPKPPPAENAKAIARQTLAKLETPAVKSVESKVSDVWRDKISGRLPSKEAFTPKLIGILLGGVLLIHLFFSYCFSCICVKAGREPGLLVWIPVLQMIPLLRAASMSAGWFVLCLVPLLNVVPYVIWCVKIVRARSLTPLVTILLLLPGLNLVGFLALAFAGAAPKEDKRVDVMTLETA